MLFKKMKKSVLQLAALLLAAAFAISVAACQPDEVGGTEDTNQTPTHADYDIDPLNQIEGSVTDVIITPKPGKSSGTVTVWYASASYARNQTVPSTAGIYAVTFDVAAVPGWNAVNGLSAGNLVIADTAKQIPHLTDYTISTNMNQTVGNVTAVTVTRIDTSKSPGTVTVWYEGVSTTSYARSQTVPSQAGMYAVTFDVAEATGWNAASSLYVGMLIIEETSTNYVTGLGWGVSSSASVLTLGLQPGNDTTEVKLNWYSSGAPAGKVAQARFVRGTLNAGFELIEVTTGGTVDAAGTTGNTYHKVTVTGLKPGASYQYAVSSDGNNWSEAYNFRVPAAGAFKFAVVADPQLHNTTWDANNRYDPNISTGSKTGRGWLDTMAKILSHGVSFIASGGDQVDASAGNETEYTLFYAPAGLRTLPFAPVSGNHDNHLNFNWHYNIPNAQTFASETVTTEAGRNYFYLYNNILFVVLNTAPYPGSASAAQPYVERFNQTLTAAKAAYAGKYDWLIVQHHKSTASVADHLADTDIQYYVEAGFEKVMSDQKVDFILAGHDHVYARSYPLDGRDGGKVSVPDKSAGQTHTYTNPGKPIYLTFTTGSGLKYYQVSMDKQFPYTNTLYVKNNPVYPYLGEVTNANGDASTFYGSVPYMTGVDGVKYLPVSNAAWVQPYIPSYCVAEVNGKTIKFSTYPIITKSGTNIGAQEAYSYNENTPYDWVQVTKN